MSFLELLSLFRGVAMFLFGMTLMGNGLKKVSGDKLEPILFRNQCYDGRFRKLRHDEYTPGNLRDTRGYPRYQRYRLGDLPELY